MDIVSSYPYFVFQLIKKKKKKTIFQNWKFLYVFLIIIDCPLQILC